MLQSISLQLCNEATTKWYNGNAWFGKRVYKRDASHRKIRIFRNFYHCIEVAMKDNVPVLTWLTTWVASG